MTTGGSYTSSFNSTSYADGSHTIIAVARDSSSNYATSTGATVTIDNTGPVSTSISATPAATTAAVTWTTNESSNSKVSYGLSSGTYTTASSSASMVTSHSLTLTGLTDSITYYYVVVSTDAQGNTSTSTEKSFQTLDATVPTVSLTSPVNGTSLSGSSVSLAATASDNISVAGVTFYIDGTRIGSEDTTSPYAGTLDCSTKADGTHSIVAVARDTSSNYATSTAASVTISNPAPQLTSVSISSNNASSTLAKVGNSVTLSFTTDQSLLSSTLSILGHTLTASNTSGNSYTASYTLLQSDTEGTVSFSLTATNLSGRAGFTTSTSTDGTAVYFDKTAFINQNSIFSTPASAQGGATIDLAPSGVASDTVCFAPIGTTDFTPSSSITCTTGNATTLLAPTDGGTYKLFVIDAAGNVSSGSSAELIVDNSAPSLSGVTMTSSAAGAYLKSGDVLTLSFTSSKALVTPTISLLFGGAPANGTVHISNVSGTTWTITYTMSADDTDGVVSFSVDGIEDLLGNMGSAVTTTSDGSSLTFDKTLPTLSSVMLFSSNASTTLAKVGDTVKVTLTASESISTPSVSFVVNSTPVNGSVTLLHLSGNDWSASYTANGSDSEGVVGYTISGFTDTAGNTGQNISSGSGSVTFDRTSPSIALTSSTPNPTGESPFSVTATFSEPVTGFARSDITVDNGIASNVAGSGSIYTFDVTPTSNGTITIDVEAGASSDGA